MVRFIAPYCRSSSLRVPQGRLWAESKGLICLENSFFEPNKKTSLFFKIIGNIYPVRYAVIIESTFFDLSNGLNPVRYVVKNRRAEFVCSSLPCSYNVACGCLHDGFGCRKVADSGECPQFASSCRVLLVGLMPMRTQHGRAVCDEVETTCRRNSPVLGNERRT